MYDTDVFSFSLINITSTSDLVMKTMGSSVVLVGHLRVAERLATFAGIAPCKVTGHHFDG